MMYSEFIERTGYSESYMTYRDYTDFIEPVYMNGNDDKDKFCKKVYKLHTKRVNEAVELMIASMSLEAKETFVSGEQSTFYDIDKAHNMLKMGFLKKLKDLYK